MANSKKRSKQTLLSFKKLKANESIETNFEGSGTDNNELSSSSMLELAQNQVRCQIPCRILNTLNIKIFKIIHRSLSVTVTA
jgi:hypothetical protein